MKQSDLGLNRSAKRTCKREFLGVMNRVVPWAALVALVTPHAPAGRRGRPPFPVQTMLRIHFMQQWFGLTDSAIEEALFDVPPYREFAGFDNGNVRLPDEGTILRFRHLLETHKLAGPMLAAVKDVLRDKGLMLRIGTVVDPTLISAPSSMENNSGQRDPEMYQTNKGIRWYYGMKAHIGVDVQSGQMHTVKGAADNINDVIEANGLVHGHEANTFGDAGYLDAHKRTDVKVRVTWYVAMCPGKRKALDKSTKLGALTDEIEPLKASVRAKVEHAFRVIKSQFGFTKVRYRGLKKNTAQITTLFALANQWMARCELMGVAA